MRVDHDRCYKPDFGIARDQIIYLRNPNGTGGNNGPFDLRECTQLNRFIGEIPVRIENAAR